VAREKGAGVEVFGYGFRGWKVVFDVRAIEGIGENGGESLEEIRSCTRG
jgi:hypothetical protein